MNNEENPSARNLLHFFAGLFKDTPVEGNNSKMFESVVKQIIIFLNRYPAFVEHLQVKISKTPNGQYFYFQRFVHIDRLNSYYGNGLRHLLSEDIEDEAKIFAHSLLVFRCWLTENAAELDRHHRLMAGYRFNDSPSPLASGRYFACLLYKNEQAGSSFVTTIHDIERYGASLETAEITGQVDFELVISEALILTGNFEDGIRYGNQALRKKQGVGMDDPVLHHLYLFTCICLL